MLCKVLFLFYVSKYKKISKCFLFILCFAVPSTMFVVRVWARRNYKSLLHHHGSHAKTALWTPWLFNCISRHNRILQQCNQQINENLEAHKHRATTFRKKHRPLQKGQTAGATSRRRHVSTSNIFTYYFFSMQDSILQLLK